MNFPVLNQIKWKLTLVILVTSTIVLMLGAAAVLIYDTINSKRNLVSHVETIAQITGANSDAALAFQNPADAQMTLNALRTRPEIESAYLCLNDGTLFVSLARSRKGTNFNFNVISAAGHRIENDRLILKRRIYLGQDPAGWIIIEANLQQEMARSNAVLKIAALCLAGLVGVALLLAARLQRLVSNPISQLAATATHITKHKDYSVRVPKESPDEIGALIRAFNQMLQEIEHQNQSIVENQHQLNLALAAAQMGSWEWEVQADRVTWSIENNHLFGPAAPALNLEAFVKLLHKDDSERVLTAFRDALTNSASFTIEYRTVTPAGETLWIAHHGQLRQEENDSAQVLTGILQNISTRKRTEAERQHLVARLLHAEEEERRRIARELHDTTAQQLAALKIGLMQSRQDTTTALDAQVISDSCRLLEQAIQEIRTLTYVLHPPLLEEFGLTGALKDFAIGITRRSGVHIKVHADDYRGRLHRNIELTLFRVVQESITNAIRHSGTKEILISLARDGQEVRVEIQDFGCGLPAPEPQSESRNFRNTGVGMAAMHERMTLIGGKLTIESEPVGVTVLASLPVSGEALEDELPPS